MKRILIKNGNVWFEDGSKITDLLLADGLIADIGRFGYRLEDCEIVDAAGLEVLPGLIDIHTHLDDIIGGVPLADTWDSGSRIALQNGITTLCGFINQRPGHDLSAAVDESLRKAGEGSYCDYAFHLTPISWEKKDWDYIEHLLSDGFRSFKFYTTYRPAGLFMEYRRLRTVMERIGEMGARVFIHCEDEAILESAGENIKDRSVPYHHALSRPPQAEVEAVKSILDLVDRASCRTHIVHVSIAGAAELIAKAKQDLPVSCETCPQYLFLSDDKLKEENGHGFICSPPLRPEADRRKIWEMACEGVFDAYATDHCAFSRKDKDGHRRDFAAVPNGLPGIGALVPLIYELHRDLQRLTEHLSLNPAKITGLYPRKGVIRKGADADVVLADIEGRERNITSSLSDVYDPFVERKTRFEVRIVFLRGQKVLEDGQLCSSEPMGRRI
jgi:dihydropyrimidinase